MANKFKTNIGFVSTEEDPMRPGIYKQVEDIKPYIVETLQFSRRRDSNDKVNDDFTLQNQYSMVMDSFARENFRRLAWIELMGARWKITSATTANPRVTFTTGGLYNAK